MQTLGIIILLFISTAASAAANTLDKRLEDKSKSTLFPHYGMWKDIADVTLTSGSISKKARDTFKSPNLGERDEYEPNHSDIKMMMISLNLSSCLCHLILFEEFN